MNDELELFESAAEEQMQNAVAHLDDTLQHIRLQGLFPCGEGAGYAGGIVTSAADGVRLAHYAKKEKS